MRPSLIQIGSPEQIRESVEMRLIKERKESPDGFMLMFGSEIPLDMPSVIKCPKKLAEGKAAYSFRAYA